MKNKVIWFGLSLLLVAAMLLASCNNATSTTTSAATSSTTSTTTKTTTSTTTSGSPTTSTSANVTTTTSTTGHWWDSLGTPQYGSSITLRLDKDISAWDPIVGGFMNVECDYLERLMVDDWTLNPNIFDYSITWRPPQYLVGQLSTGWEFTNPNTFTFHLRPGVKYANIAPANGREFVASDVVYHYSRLYGIGQFKGIVAVTGNTFQTDLVAMTTPDKYTVSFQWKSSNPETIMETMLAVSTGFLIFNPDAVQSFGGTTYSVTDWRHAIGTGPFIVTDFISSSSATLTKNPDYWGYDERYPQNKLPYVSTVKYLIIVDGNTALAAMRTGKIDAQDALSRIQAAAMSKTNPEILQSAGLNNANTTMDPRNDTAPFNDIRVRQAMQKLIDIPLIASTYYGGRALSYPIALTCYAEAGWAWTYDQWPQDLKDEYKYDLAGAKKLLADAGLPNGFHTNLRVDNSADQDLVLLVQSAFASAGIVMDIIGMDSASWNSYVQVGKKHDQMCMRAGGSLGLSYEPLRQLYRFQTGYSTDYAMVSNASFDSYYPAFNNSTSIDQEKQIILAANQLVARQHFVITLPESFTYTLVQPWVVGFNNQGGVFSSGGTGPSCGNYLARFWINQKMKTAMGH